MYSALNKLYRAFMHTVAVALFIGLMAAAAQTPIEIAARLGYQWARHVIAYFAEGGR